MTEVTIFDWVVYYLVIVSLVMLLINTFRVLMFKIYSNMMGRALFDGKEEKFNKLYKGLGHFFVTKGEYEEIRFDIYTMQNNREKAEEVIEETMKSRIRAISKRRLYPKFFYYYLDFKKYDKVKEIYPVLSKIPAYKGKKEIDRYYEAFIEGGHKSLKECETELKRARGKKQVDLEKIISQMLENQGIHSEAKKYARLAEKHERELHNKQ